MVRIIEPPFDPTQGLADVLVGSIGLTGAILLIAVVSGVILAGLLSWIRSRQV